VVRQGRGETPGPTCDLNKGGHGLLSSGGAAVTGSRWTPAAACCLTVAAGVWPGLVGTVGWGGSSGVGVVLGQLKRGVRALAAECGGTWAGSATLSCLFMMAQIEVVVYKIIYYSLIWAVINKIIYDGLDLCRDK
jgi:hypothetical protein